MAREGPAAQAGLPEDFRLQSTGAWRLGPWGTAAAWGAAAAISLTAAAFIAQSGPAKERLQQLFAVTTAFVSASANTSTEPVPAEPATQRTAEQAEINHLAEQARALASDHDRLMHRMAILEQRLETVTGSIGRRNAPATDTPSVKKAIPAPDSTEPSASTVEPLRPPTHTGTAPAPAQKTALPVSLSMTSITPITPTIASVVRPPATIAAAPVDVLSNATKATGKQEHHETAAIKLPSLVRLPPRRAPAYRTASHLSFGVDLGDAASVDEVKAQWAAIKANFGPVLTGLRSVPTHDPRPGQGPYQLVIGPLPDMAAARNLCAQFATGHVACRPVELKDDHLARR